MRKVIEYTLISADGVFESPKNWGALGFRDEAYLRDGLDSPLPSFSGAVEKPLDSSFAPAFGKKVSAATLLKRQ